ncbi:hypothetical protein ACIGMX_12630 [Streptomyces aquilus]|uniref:hypothetical protein n=1 Tax=Streptomyces aquilus TaxID=2548456 RepID=UPI0037D0D282
MPAYTRPAPPNGPGRCDRCGADVIWCLNANRKTQAVNAERRDYGNQAVRQDAAGRWHVRQLTKDRPTLEGSEALHYPHAATCTNPAPRRPPGSPRDHRGVRPVRWQR